MSGASGPARVCCALFVVMLAVLGVGGSAKAQLADDRISAAAVDDFVRAELDRTGLPGVAVAVTRNGRVLRAAGYGQDSGGAPLGPDSPMRLGSLSKSFTAAAVLHLVRNGRFTVDQPVRELLPRFRPADPLAGRITVRHLLNQTSGLADTTIDTDAVATAGSLNEVLRALDGATLNHEPGRVHQYTNVNYFVLGALIERLTGRSYGAYLRTSVLAPLGMTCTFDGVFGPNRPGYFEAYGTWFARQEPRGVRTGAGSVTSSASDMARWLLAQQGQANNALPANELRTMHTPPPGQSYAMGWETGELPGPRQVFHGGNLLTATAVQGFVPRTGYGFAVLANGGAFADAAETIYAGLLAMSEGRPIPAADNSTQSYVDFVPAALTVLALGLGVLGAVRAGRWARRHASTGAFGVTLRIVPLLLPLGVAVFTPELISSYVLGGRAVTWLEMSYTTLPLVVLVLGAALLGVLVALLRLLRLPNARAATASR